MGLPSRISQGHSSREEPERQPPHILKLPFDVLLHIAPFLSPRYLSVLTRTCHALHRALAPELVNRPVHLTSENMASFSAFMHKGTHAEDDERFRLLRRARVHPLEGRSKGALSPVQMGDAIAGLLHRACNLTSLTLLNVSYTFSPRQIREALAFLPALQSIMLSGLTSEYTSVLAEVTSPLQRLALHTGFRDSRDALQYVGKHHATLTHLALQSGESSIALPDHTASFPQVRELRLGMLQGDLNVGRNLMRVFPNARRVYMDALKAGGGRLDREPDPSLSVGREWRAATKDAVRKARGGDCWRKLHLLSIRSLSDLYFLGLSCKVSHLNLRSIGGITGTPVEPAIVRAALADVRPARLDCCVGSKDFPMGVADLFQAICATKSVVRLLLDLCDAAPSPFELNVSGVLKHFSLLRNAPSLTHLLIHAKHSQLPLAHHAGPHEVDLTAPSSQRGPERTCDVMVLEALTRSVPGLQCVFLDVVGMDGGGSKAWRLADITTGKWDRFEREGARAVLVAQGMVPLEEDY
ncbi:hypothetical protein BV20DRAFT_1051770 [Pilatotrama ljubarskyi]|nr:hypothetical protein BV20DRAFT_1051770 [Pilatotrama ljubarskyi]